MDAPARPPDVVPAGLKRRVFPAAASRILVGRASAAATRAACVAVVSLLVLASCRSARAEDSALESAIKATYLYKFIPFIAWPSVAFDSPTTPFVLCIAGDDPFGTLLDRAVSERVIEGRPVVVRRFPTIDPGSGCHIAFIGGSPAQSISAALEALRGTPVLTVTDSVPDGTPMGIVNFVLLDNHVRFEIDARAASANGLTISSKLLQLAVQRRPRS